VNPIQTESENQCERIKDLTPRREITEQEGTEKRLRETVGGPHIQRGKAEEGNIERGGRAGWNARTLSYFGALDERKTKRAGKKRRSHIDEGLGKDPRREEKKKNGAV